MNDPYREPIDEEIDLREKFVGGGEAKPISRTKASPTAGVRKAVERGERAAAERDATYQSLMKQLRAKAAQGSAHVGTHAHTVASDARAVHGQHDVESQVSHLLDIAVTKGPTHAVKVARHLSDFYIMDAVHDRMVQDAFFKKLKEKNMI